MPQRVCGTASPPVSPTAALALKKIGILPKPKLLITKVEQFLDVHPKELARQLTLIVSAEKPILRKLTGNRTKK